MSASPTLPKGSGIGPRLSGIILGLFVLYFGYSALNTLGLSNQSGVATVLDKAYYPPGTSHQTMNIGGRSFIRPYQTAEIYVLKLRLNNQETPALVEKSLYDKMNTNVEVQVVYRVTRITKVLQVTQVTGAVEKGGN
jgi:hypothetical protein